MSHDLTASLTAWNKATSDLPWGAQAVFHDTLSLVKDGSVSLAYGADYRDGKPCLVNAVGQMLASGGGYGIPSSHYGQMVGLFDRINRGLEESKVNDKPGWVSTLAAEILLTHFGPLKSPPADDTSIIDAPYKERTDAEMAAALGVLELDSRTAPDDDFLKGYDNVNALYV